MTYHESHDGLTDPSKFHGVVFLMWHLYVQKRSPRHVYAYLVANRICHLSCEECRFMVAQVSRPVEIWIDLRSLNLGVLSISAKDRQSDRPLSRIECGKVGLTCENSMVLRECTSEIEIRRRPIVLGIVEILCKCSKI